MIDGKAIAAGDDVIGIRSSGLHSNGYSLARKIAFEVAGLNHDDYCQPLGGTVGKELLRPTIIYAQLVRRILEDPQTCAAIHGIAHITGGGICENIQRILPSNVDIRLTSGSWPIPPIFTWLQSVGDIDEEEMQRVFNLGIGLILIVQSHQTDDVLRICQECGQPGHRIGRAVTGSAQVDWAGGVIE